MENFIFYEVLIERSKACLLLLSKKIRYKFKCKFKIWYKFLLYLKQITRLLLLLLSTLLSVLLTVITQQTLWVITPAGTNVPTLISFLQSTTTCSYMITLQIICSTRNYRHKNNLFHNTLYCWFRYVSLWTLKIA